MTDPVLVLRSPTYRKALERAGIKQDDVDLWEVRPRGRSSSVVNVTLVASMISDHTFTSRRSTKRSDRCTLIASRRSVWTLRRSTLTEVPCESLSGWDAFWTMRFSWKTTHTLIRFLLFLWLSVHWDTRLVSKQRRSERPNRALISEPCLSSRNIRMHRSPSSSHRSRRAQEEGRRRSSLVHVDVCRSRVSRTYRIRIWEKQGVLIWAGVTLCL